MRLDNRRTGACGWLVLLLLAGLLSGCSKEGAVDSSTVVSGTVTFAGKAPDLDGLLINFISETGGPSVGAVVQRNGTFTAKGVPAGKVLVGLVYIDPERTAAKQKLDKDRAAGIKQKMAETPGIDEVAAGHLWDFEHPDEIAALRAMPVTNPIPQKFRDPHASGMSLVVEALRENTFNCNVPTE